MKKIILILLLLPIFGFAQDCKFEKNEIDPFTKGKFVRTKSKPIVSIFSPTQNIRFQFEFNKSAFINVFVQFSNHKKFNINSGHKFQLLLNDQSVITMIINTDAEADRNPGLMLGPMTDFKFKVETTLDELTRVRDIGIIKIRLETTEDEKDFDVKNQKNKENIKEMLNCFLSEISK
jgi:hypothetical protein